MATDKKTDKAKIKKLLGNTYMLVDAKNAGGEFSDKCTLILTEIDSAMAFAVGGVDKNYYGVFPLGDEQPLNVREASHEQIMENAEIQNIILILGLEYGKVYESVKSLRYGHLMIMTNPNQNHDGIRIKGLLINLIHFFWPSLLKIPSFLGEFIVPKVEATHKDGQVLYFYNMPQYESWKKSLGGEKNWTIDNYEGLPSRSNKKIKEYFQSLETYKRDFTWVYERDGDAIDMAFNKNKIEARKTWLQQYEPGTYLDRAKKLIKYNDFVNKELILVFFADLQRFIPSMVDGLKLGQRKILFCAFKCNLVNESLDGFSGDVSQHFGYSPPGEHARTIIGMAQDFVGTNNINLFSQGGLFGTRYQGVKFTASVISCLFTSLAPITRFLFPKDDGTLLDNLNENRQHIEPTWYAPVIPLVLVNGSEGCGTGECSTFVPSYNPRDLCASVRSLLRGEPMVPIHPWYKGFQGTIEKTTVKESGTSYTISGIIDQINETTLRITEIPIGIWIQDYEEFLVTAMFKERFIEDYYVTPHPTNVDFKIIMSKENLQMAKEEGLMKVFKLTSTISTSNMILFDQNGTIKKYDNPEQILEEFFELRFDLYKKRREMLLEDIALEISKLRNTKRYISCVLSGDIDLISVAKNSATVLRKEGFDAFPKKERCSHSSDNPYEYLRSVSLLNFNEEKVMELDSQIKNLVLQQQELRDSTPETLWMKDLDALDKELDEVDARALIHEKILNGKRRMKQLAPDSSSMEMGE